MKQITGQMSLFDIHESGKRKPCEYSFQRYIGQEVGLGCGVRGRITEIEAYYTIITARDKDGITRDFCGGPCDVYPIREEER